MTRVVLNLSEGQARELLETLRGEHSEIARKVCIRISKTLAKHGIPSEEIPCDVMEAIEQAAQDIENQRAQDEADKEGGRYP